MIPVEELELGISMAWLACLVDASTGIHAEKYARNSPQSLFTRLFLEVFQ